MSLRFALLHEAHFTIARFWRFGADCVSCDDAEYYAAVAADVTIAPWWEITSECRRCS